MSRGSRAAASWARTSPQPSPKRRGSAQVAIGGQDLGPLRTSYSDVPLAEPLAIINSLDHLEIAINQGNAETDLNIKVGTPVKVVTK